MKYELDCPQNPVSVLDGLGKKKKKRRRIQGVKVRMNWRLEIYAVVSFKTVTQLSYQKIKKQ